jgi:IclR family acetate operon transcriptional repressor
MRNYSFSITEFKMPLSPVQSLNRGLEILELVIASPEGLTLNELAEALDIAPPTVFNLAGTLIAKGYLEKTERPIRYRLGDRLVDLITNAPETPTEKIFARLPRLRALLNANSILYTEWIGVECLRAARVDSVRPEVVQRPRSVIDTPYLLATGLCILAYLNHEERLAYTRRYPLEHYGAALWSSEAALEAFLQSVRETGYCLPPQGNLGKIAIPLWNRRKQLIGSIGASFTTPLDPNSADIPFILSSLLQSVEAEVPPQKARVTPKPNPL